MANPYGYNFYFKDGSDVLTFPITPAELSIKVGSKNKVVTLIGEGDINILKSPSLIEVEFEARFPMRKYPYSREVSSFEQYFNKFKELKEDKKSFRFIVARTTPNGTRTWDTNLLMALEDFELTEDADEGDDVLISFKLKQYKEYGVKTLKVASSKPETTSTSNTPRSTDNKGTKSETHTVKSGDTLWSIAKKYYDNGAKYMVIYNANKTTIENEAKKHGKSSSFNGHWIYPGTKLIIPSVNSISNSTSNSVSPQKSEVKPKVTLTIDNTGIKEYYGSYTLYVNGAMRRSGKASDYTITVSSGDKIKIIPKGINGHSYIISQPEFTITQNKTVELRWVR
jgi:LysM repeat protein